MSVSDDDEYSDFSDYDIYDTEDSESYYDEDEYFDDYDFLFRIYSPRLTAQLKRKEEADSDDETPEIFQPKSLIDNCCKYLALNFPFAYLQDRIPPIPDDLQLKVITFSFPEDENEIKKYAELSSGSFDLRLPKSMCDRVIDMKQIGFRLSASVDEEYVIIHFDRGKITLAKCSCGDSDGWCSHILATTLKRVKQARKLDKSQVRLPQSDALYTFSREQLLKFSQYLLYHYQSDKVVEIAQDLIDKLVNRHGDYDNEDINVIPGAPDPSAGPGLDEESHWFMSEKGFQRRCNSILNEESLCTLGFVSQEKFSWVVDDLRYLWYSNRCGVPLVKDEVDIALGKAFFGSCQTRRTDSAIGIVETVLDLLQDDSTIGLIAIKCLTKQVVSYITRKKQHETPLPDCFVSPVMGFTARPFRSWALCDELSRLWQVAVLSPKLKAKERELVAQDLLNWNQKVQTESSENSTASWQGLQIAYNLCQQINWTKPAMQNVIHGQIPDHFAISGITLVEVKLQQDKTVQCHLPYCFTYGSISLDVLTWLAIIHTLDMLNFKDAAVNVALCLSVALVALYRYNADTRLHIPGMPILRKCCLDYSWSKGSTNKDSKQQAANNDVDKKKVESIHELEKNECLYCPSIWPDDVLVTLRSFAFLYNVLLSNKSKVECCIVNQKHHLENGLGITKPNGVLDNISNTDSLVFQVGAIGLLLPKFHMSSMRQEVELYDLENWLTFQLLDMTAPRSSDIDFLCYLCQTVMKEGPHWLFPPCSSFTRVVLHHTYKELSCLRSEVLKLAFQGLEFTLIQDNIEAYPQNLFEISVAVSWCKLAELALRILIVNNDPSLVERAMSCVLNKNGMLGEGLLKLQDLYEDYLSTKNWLCLALAKALFSMSLVKKSKKSNDYSTGHKCIGTEELSRGVTTRKLDVFPMVSSSSDITSVKKCAIRLGARSAYYITSLDSHPTFRWLVKTSTECGLWGVQCLLSCRDEVIDFLPHRYAMDLCKRLLKKEENCNVKDLIKQVLLSLLKHAAGVNTEDVSKVKDILSFCRRHNKNAYDFLIPWVSEHLRVMAHTKTVHPEALLLASEDVFRCYKKRLNKKIAENSDKFWPPIVRKNVHPKCVADNEPEEKRPRLDDTSTADDAAASSLGFPRESLVIKRQLFNEETEEEPEEECKLCPLDNPYMTISHPHPLIELSFDLGIMGLNALTNAENEQFERYYIFYKRLKKDHVIKLCDLVGYITNQKWLHKTSDEYKTIPCLSGILCDVDDSYVARFVHDLLKLDMSTMMLMTILCEAACKLQTENSMKQLGDNPKRKMELLQQIALKFPCFNPLLKRIECKFHDLLLGSKMSEVLKRITSQRARTSFKDHRLELEWWTLEDSTLLETLISAKIVHEVNDPSGETFKKLLCDIDNTHNCKELKVILDSIGSGEEVSCPGDQLDWLRLSLSFEDYFLRSR